MKTLSRPILGNVLVQQHTASDFARMTDASIKKTSSPAQNAKNEDLALNSHTPCQSGPLESTPTRYRNSLICALLSNESSLATCLERLAAGWSVILRQRHFAWNHRL